MGLIPIDIEDLQVGLFIKLDYGWGAHPFLRNSFKISSPKDIGIIRKHNLTKITYDPSRSDPAAIQALSSPPSSHAQGEPTGGPSQEEIEEAEETLQAQKGQLHQEVFSYQDSLNATEKAYREAMTHHKTAMQMLSLGEAEGVDRAKQVLESVLNVLNTPAPTLTLVNAPFPEDSTEERSLVEEVSIHSMNVCSLALLLGETLTLNQEDRHTLGLGAMLHNIGLHRVLPAIRKKPSEARSTKERQAHEAYPYFGQQMLQSLSGISPEHLAIISQHQENLDGSGYPQGLKGEQIGYLPRVVRVVKEYESLVNNGHGAGRLIPTQALTYLYTKMKELCQPDIIEAFIATVTVYPPGSLVRLTDDSVGLVVKTNKSDRLRPLVVLLETDEESEDLAIVDMVKAKELSIKESLHPKDLDPKVKNRFQEKLWGIKGFFVSS